MVGFPSETGRIRVDRTGRIKPLRQRHTKHGRCPKNGTIREPLLVTPTPLPRTRARWRDKQLLNLVKPRFCVRFSLAVPFSPRYG